MMFPYPALSTMRKPVLNSAGARKEISGKLTFSSNISSHWNA